VDEESLCGGITGGGEKRVMPCGEGPRPSEPVAFSDPRQRGRGRTRSVGGGVGGAAFGTDSVMRVEGEKGPIASSIGNHHLCTMRNTRSLGGFKSQKFSK